ncbi:hypothetical protein CspHIS471_0211200 [Cutaneotrichosporon sp. HIS471]|nr:hypothetical protein CspHIS471_0211200 [Cutaneotrichosporon sp. HIS471]
MILLESHNVIIHDVLSDRFERPSRADIQFVDFDAVRFHLSTPESKTVIVLSMAIQCWSDLAKYGARESLEKEYAGYIVPESETEPEYNVSLAIDLERLPATQDERAELIRHVSLIKRNAIAAPFNAAFEEQKALQANYKDAAGAQMADAQQQETKGELMTINHRDGEAIFVRASHDRVTVIFSTVFKEETDRIFGRVFLQEFYDARKLQSLQSAPQVTYSNREPPLEIRHLPGLKRHENVGYVTFILAPRHFANPAQAFSTISHIQLFRDYLHYHIKCSKAYMQSRMRFRVAEFLKVLNRAKPESEEKERRTVTGRTFRSR